MVHASTLLEKERFWHIIEQSNKGTGLEEKLMELSEQELFGFRYWWQYFHYQSYDQALWAAAYAILGGCSDDGFDYFRFWLLTRGKEVYTKALQEPDSLYEEFLTLEDGDIPEWEEADYIALEVYEEKFGKDFYDAEACYDSSGLSLPKIEFEWDESDEASIRKICPRIFDQWWD